MASQDAALAQATQPTLPFHNLKPWYYNDHFTSPWRFGDEHERRPITDDIAGIHRYLDENPDDRQAYYSLSDAHGDMGDEGGQEFWHWWAREDRAADFYEGFWWFDNNLIPADKSRFRIPSSIITMFQDGVVRYPKIDPTDPDNKIVWPNQGDKIELLGFDGRILAQTSALAAWRLLTEAELEALLVRYDYDFIDPVRLGK